MKKIINLVELFLNLYSDQSLGLTFPMLLCVEAELASFRFELQVFVRYRNDETREETLVRLNSMGSSKIVSIFSAMEKEVTPVTQSIQLG